MFYLHLYTIKETTEPSAYFKAFDSAASDFIKFKGGENLCFPGKIKFFLLTFPRSAHLYTPLARQPAISALNHSPGSVLTKNSPNW